MAFSSGSSIPSVSGRKVYVEGMGCALSRADAEGLANVLRDMGAVLVSDMVEAEVVFINGCTVRESSDIKLASKVKQAKRLGAQVVVTGCTAEANPAAAKGAFLLPLRDREKYLGRARGGGSSFEALPSLLPPAPSGPVYMLPIGSGCGGNCSFCVTRLARGRIISYPSETVIKLARKAIEAGAAEIDLTAVEINSWGKDTRESFPDLLRSLGSLEGEFAIRVGMLNPRGLLSWLDDLLDAFEGEKVFKFFHLPAQSFSDAVLSRMRRGYSSWEVVEIISKVRARFPTAFLETDVIAGFPGETEDDFQATVDWLEKLRFDKVNIARYSPRPMTEAAGMPQLREDEKKRRSDVITALWRRLALEINSSYVGRPMRALLVEAKGSQAICRAENYKQLVSNAIPEKRGWGYFYVERATPIDVRGRPVALGIAY